MRLVDTVPCLQDEEFLQGNDGSPRFDAAFISRLDAFPAFLQEGGAFDWGDPDSELRVTKDTQGDRSPLFQVHGVWSDFTALEITIVLQRHFTKRDYTHYSKSLERKPTAKSSLLEAAERTGDLVLVAGEGVEVPAHSAVLVDFPYFEAKLREEWAGKSAWNLHNKLRLELPVPVKKEALVAFLTYVYGDTCSIYKIEPSSASFLQDILSLADACGVPALCSDVIGLVLVTSANVDSWLAWLLKQHGVDATPIRQQVVKVMKEKLQNGLRWDELSLEQLTNVAALQKSLATLVAPPENKG